MSLLIVQLVLKLDGDFAFQRESVCAALPDWSAWELDRAWELGCVHDRIGVNGNQDVLLSLGSQAK